MHRRITITDVAEKAGVSKGTVSAVINDKQTVKSSTKEHVLKVMKDLNFRPKGQARFLRRKNIEKSLGLIIRELNNPFYTALAKGVKKYANANNYIVFISSTEGDHIVEERTTRICTSKDVKGVIIAPVMNGNHEIEHLFQLKTINYPFVLLEAIQGIQANVVSIDNKRATKEAVKFLIDRGHTRIIHFAGPKVAYHTEERISGFRDGFSESPLIYNKDLIIRTGALFEDGFETGLKYFKNISDEMYPMAVVCFNDSIAFGLMAALQKLGIKVPEQVSIIGNDDVDLADQWNPGLTTISTPLEELGETAAQILIENIESTNPLPIRNYRLDTKLVERGTTLTIS